VEKANGLIMIKSAKCWVKNIPKPGQECGFSMGLLGLNTSSIDSPVRWEHCGYPVPEMEPDTEHRQCPHKGEEPHDYPDSEDRWKTVDEEAQRLQLHQVPAPGLTTTVSLCYTNLKEK
jgi:hypothetical protein